MLTYMRMNTHKRREAMKTSSKTAETVHIFPHMDG